MSLVSEIKKIISEQKKERVKNRRNESAMDFYPNRDYMESYINDAKIDALEEVLKLIK
jgi:hypothetical protein